MKQSEVVGFFFCSFVFCQVKKSFYFNQAECSDRKGWQKDVQPSQGLWATKTWLQFMILILKCTSKTYWRNHVLKKHFQLFQLPKSPCVAHSALQVYLILNKEISTLENLAIVPVPPLCPTHSPLPHSQPQLSVIAGSKDGSGFHNILRPVQCNFRVVKSVV